ncbi:MAG TPA: TlpA disulfide reductase family protein [Actinomycetota bacterium]|nr:TlpA disulfide reductase family protein [Actinomycetota bacterium]
MAGMEDPVTGAPRRSRSIRIALLLVPAALFVGLLGFGLGASGSAPVPGDPAPAFTAPLLDDRGRLALDDFDGRPVVVNFWASWCVPCIDEAPMFGAAYERYGERVAFVGINIRDARSDARAFVAKHDLDYPNVRDERLEIYRDYGLTGQPETFVIDGDGTIVAHVPGALPSEGRLFDLIETALSHG